MASIEKDPTFALAYAGLADSFSVSRAYGFLPPLETWPKAKAAAQKALDIDDSLGEAHASLGASHLFFDRDWRAAEKQFKQAILLSPGHATAHMLYAIYFNAIEQFDASIAAIKRAQQLDPLSLIIQETVDEQLYAARRYDEAIAEL